MLDVLVGSFNVPLTWLVNILSHFVSLKPGLGGLIKLEIKRKSSSIFDAIKKNIYKSWIFKYFIFITDSEEYFCVKRIFSGGDQSFSHYSNPQVIKIIWIINKLR